MRNTLKILMVLAGIQIYADQQTQEQNELPFKQGDQRLSQGISPSYNFPAGIKLKEGYDVLLTASYLYWYSGEGGLDLATSVAYLSDTNTVIPSSKTGSIIFQDFDYASGFKVGLGGRCCSDGWIVRADYTRFHHESTSSASAPSAGNGARALYFTDWFIQVSPQGQGIASSKLSSKWDLKLDWLDLVVERPYYLARRGTITPFFGLRSSWIKQALDVKAKDALNVSPGSTLSSNNHSSSWGIGPRAGLEGRFLLGWGFRAQGELGGSLLYTHYSTVSHTEESFTGGSDISYAMHSVNCVRPMIEAGLGLGWGMYLWDQRFHIDFSATYDFNYFWSQNMIRVLNDLEIIGTNAAANDLYLHGLTLTGAFHF